MALREAVTRDVDAELKPVRSGEAHS
eukprot:COSAG02_NODE_17622_length_990_cov_340.904602_1_plen_25_part_01